MWKGKRERERETGSRLESLLESAPNGKIKQGEGQ